MNKKKLRKEHKPDEIPSDSSKNEKYGVKYDLLSE
jgi:hypothetical protein